MNSATLKRAKIHVEKAVSVLTLLALVVAPACAPLCATRACALARSAVGTESHCGSSEAAGKGAIHFHAVQNCGSPQAQAASLPNTNWRVLLRLDRTTISGGGVGILSATTHRFASQKHGAVRGAPTGPPGSSRFPADAVVLRI